MKVDLILSLLQHGADLRAAAMHHHRVDAGLLHQHDVLGESIGSRSSPMALPPYFTTMVFWSYLQNVGQRLDQHAAVWRQRASVAGSVLRLVDAPAMAHALKCERAYTRPHTGLPAYGASAADGCAGRRCRRRPCANWLTESRPGRRYGVLASAATVAIMARRARPASISSALVSTRSIGDGGSCPACP